MSLAPAILQTRLPRLRGVPAVREVARHQAVHRLHQAVVILTMRGVSTTPSVASGKGI